jgi:hypothetical protein
MATSKAGTSIYKTLFVGNCAKTALDYQTAGTVEEAKEFLLNSETEQSA